MKVSRILSITILSLSLGLCAPATSYAQGIDNRNALQKMAAGMRTLKDRIASARDAMDQMRDMKRRADDIIRSNRAKTRDNNCTLRAKMRDNKTKMKQTRASAKAKQRDNRDKMRSIKSKIRDMKSRMN